MRIHPEVTLARVTEAVERAHSSLDNPGFCICCGAETEGVEPDARRCDCEFLRRTWRLRRRGAGASSGDHRLTTRERR